MEIGKEHHGKGTNRAKVDISMAKGPMFIHPPILIVLRIVGQGREDLKEKMSEQERRL
jgi:hypothetical protein